MNEKKLLTIRLYLTGIVTIAIGALLVWNHYNGGVPSHHLAADDSFPAISNWWGALVLPLLTWFLLYRIQKGIFSNTYGEAETRVFLPGILYGFAGGLLFGILIAVCFTSGYTDIIDYLMLGLLLLALFFPIYRAQCLLGFVLAMTYTFGAVLPTAFGAVVCLVGWVLYRFIRPVILYVVSKFVPSTWLIIPVVLCLYFAGATEALALNDSRTERPTANQLLTEVHQKLESLTTIRYDYIIELNYASENYNQSISGTAFLDFTTPDSLLGFKYQVESENGKFVYNGSESFYLDKARKTMTVNVKPKFENFSGITPFHNSLVTLRKAIPALVADRDIIKSVSDTSIAEQDFYLVKLMLNKRTIERLGGFSGLSLERRIIYDIIIDKSSLMPVQMIQGNSANSDFTRSVFRDVRANPASPSELSWYFSSYTTDFDLERKKPLVPLALHAPAPAWELPLFDSSQPLSLSQLKGKVVVLEFWTKNCGYCIAAVPKLNALSKKFQGKEFVVLGVNLHDKVEDIQNFNQRTKPNYKTVYKGQKVAEEYGIGFFPTIVLLGKKGKVLFHGEFNEADLNSLILKALKE